MRVREEEEVAMWQRQAEMSDCAMPSDAGSAHGAAVTLAESSSDEESAQSLLRNTLIAVANSEARCESKLILYSVSANIF